MNKADLVDLLASTHSLSKAEAGRILETLLSTIVKTVKKGGSVGIAGFGAFKMQARSARGGYNPATRSKMKIPAVKVPKFSPGTAFRAEVDPRAAARKAAAARAAAAAEAPVAAADAGGVRGAAKTAAKGATKGASKVPAKAAAKAPAKAATGQPAATGRKTAAPAAAKTAVKAAANAAKKAPSAKRSTQVAPRRARSARAG
ncbi:MAG: HU family DNA-binding protein [Rubrivivax sp.]